MSVSVEPHPLHEPLAGGTRGATVAVEPLVAGHVDWPKAMMVNPGGRMMTAKLLRALMTGKDALEVPIPAFLIRHPSAGAILVDTGLHPSVATDPSENFGSLATRFGKLTLAPGEDVPSQLRKRGLDSGEIPIVVMTHLHMDHSSAISEFPKSTFVVSEREWRFASGSGGSAQNGYRRAHFDYAFEYRTVDFDRDNVDSYASFGRTFDLLGDGSIRLAFTPGHSAGHMSVICRLAKRDFVIAGDCVYMLAQLDGSEPGPPRPQDAHNLRRSLQELRLFRTQFPDAIVTPGHDPDFYARLEQRYE
ncbi:MAG TPA: N-acyl homoserine lactonase family protein [Solirubrobacterales bacterium]|jgi:glyoxylase-like metal-dependent hydrolase (beta-lactamase superfamily II)|nr:N-acyl homoserine lactonase family protein [Solirubrobacterales bacterium]